MGMKIIHGGSFSTLQDGGRYGMAHWGFPPSGFMDDVAAQMANRMVGNAMNEALIEMTWTGIEFTVAQTCSVALAGAEFKCLLNDQPVATDTVIHLHAGDHFKMGHLESGVRAYLAVAGGFALPLLGRSASTLVLAGVGGYQGRALVKGDQLEFKHPQLSPKRKKPSWHQWPNQKTHVVRAVVGPEFGLFEDRVSYQALSQAYQISQDSSRQGFRLTANAIKYPKGFSMLSSGLIPGTLQVTPDGQTILAMKDGQTTGGYPRLLVVKQTELYKLAQIRPDQEIYFFCDR